MAGKCEQTIKSRAEIYSALAEDYTENVCDRIRSKSKRLSCVNMGMDAKKHARKALKAPSKYSPDAMDDLLHTAYLIGRMQSLFGRN